MVMNQMAINQYMIQNACCAGSQYCGSYPLVGLEDQSDTLCYDLSGLVCECFSESTQVCGMFRGEIISTFQEPISSVYFSSGTDNSIRGKPGQMLCVMMST